MYDCGVAPSRHRVGQLRPAHGKRPVGGADHIVLGLSFMSKIQLVSYQDEQFPFFWISGVRVSFQDFWLTT